MKETSHHLTTCLERAVAQWPQCNFLLGNETLSYHESWDRVARLAVGLRSLGVVAGDRVLIVAENRTEVALLCFAVSRLGAVFSVLSPQLRPEGLLRIVQVCSPACIFLGADTAHLRAGLTGKVVVWLDEVSERTHEDLSYASLLASPNLEIPAHGSTEDPAFLVFTSGSTGSPRGVIMTHGNVQFVSQVIQQRLQYRASDRIGVFLPLAFDYSLYQLFYAALTGASVFIGRPDMTGAPLPRLLALQQITILPAVPTVIGGLLKMQRYRPTPLPDLRAITNTGDHLPRAYLDQLHELLPQCAVFPMYGLTECKRVSILLPEEFAEHPDSVGRPLDGTAVVAVDPAGHRLPTGEVGELVISGPHVSPGYWQALEETAKRFRLWEGKMCLFSGDQGSVDAAGFITFHGRGETVIKHRGYRLNPAEVEEAACKIPAIQAAGCVKDEIQDKLFLFVTTASTAPSESAILNALAEKLERGKLPDRIVFLPELPKTSNQKLDRKALRLMLTTL